MERITNVRISTLTKSVAHDGDVSIVSVGLNNGHVFAVDSEGNTHDMGAIIISNIEIAAPQVASEGCGCNTPNANVIAKLLRGVDGVDGITPDMTDYYQKREIDSRLKEKQDVIGDLETIRSGAAKGATAVQPASLADYVSKDEVDAELSETSTNPIQNQAVMNTLLTWEEVLGGILDQKQPVISDLDTIRQGAAKGATALQASDVDSEMSEVSTNPIQNKTFSQAFMQLIEEFGLALASKQNSIHDLQTIREGAAKGATALQEEAYKGTVTAVKINGETKNPSDGIVDLGEVSGGSADLKGYATEEYVDNAVDSVNVKGEDGYVYSNGEKVDMRIRRSLIPIGTLIPAKANLNTIAYLKVGNYYCSQTSNAVTIKNCPVDVAFSMEVFNPLSEILDDETTAQYTYRIRKITAYNTGVQYIQYCNTSGTAGTWTYGSWYVMPRTSFSLASDKNGGSAVKGGSTRGVYIDASGTFQQMGYTIATSVPKNAVFTDTNTKVTAVGNHYAPVEDESVVIEAPDGEVVVGLKRDAAGHVVGVMSTPMSGGGGGGIAVETDVYIADFTMYSLRTGMNSGTDVDCNMQALVAAMNANKVILVREDENLEGVHVLNGFAEDLLYFSIVDTSGNILWCDGTDYISSQGIGAQTLHLRSWDSKQDTLVSGENIKTINGKSILGSGNITISGNGSAQLPLNTVIKILNGSTLAIPSGKVTELAFLQTGGGTFALSADKKFGEDNVWVIRFSISIDNLGIYQVVAAEGYSIKWANGVAPTFENGKYYEMSFRLIGTTFLGVWASFE